MLKKLMFNVVTPAVCLLSMLSASVTVQAAEAAPTYVTYDEGPYDYQPEQESFFKRNGLGLLLALAAGAGAGAAVAYAVNKKGGTGAHGAQGVPGPIGDTGAGFEIASVAAGTALGGDVDVETSVTFTFTINSPISATSVPSVYVESPNGVVVPTPLVGDGVYGVQTVDVTIPAPVYAGNYGVGLHLPTGSTTVGELLPITVRVSAVDTDPVTSDLVALPVPPIAVALTAPQDYPAVYPFPNP